jgi:lipoprotein-anchoring transpeptidase ErfK/SrfK
MRLSASSPNFLTVLAVPFFVTMVAFSAHAETHPKAGPTSGQAASTTQSTAENTPQADSNGSAENSSEEASSEPVAEDRKPASDQPASESAAAISETPKSSILVNIDKSVQEMTVFVDGIEQYRWPVSTGTRGYSTPSGTFTASSMNKIWYSKQWDNAPMPHAIFFTKKGHAIHGTYEEKRLGAAASHGCVRLSRQNASTLFDLVEKNGLANTQVVLVGTTPGGEGPNVASPGPSKRPQGAYPPPWFEPGSGFYAQPGQKQKRRGLFGRRWFQPNVQGYNAPRYYPRGVGPRGY